MSLGHLLFSVILLLFSSADADPQEVVEDAALQYFQQQYPDVRGKLAVQVKQVWGLERNETDIRILSSTTSGIPSGYTRIDLAAESSDGLRRGWALLYVSRFDSVLIARHDLAAGDTLRAESLRTIRKEITQFRGNPLTASFLAEDSADKPYVTTRPIREGSVLRTDLVRKPYTMNLGDPVTLIYRQDPITVTLNCTARQPGHQGDTVRVYCDETRATYRAEIENAQYVHWRKTL